MIQLRMGCMNINESVHTTSSFDAVAVHRVNWPLNVNHKFLRLNRFPTGTWPSTVSTCVKLVDLSNELDPAPEENE